MLWGYPTERQAHMAKRPMALVTKMELKPKALLHSANHIRMNSEVAFSS